MNTPIRNAAKRLLALVVNLVMLFGLIPATALAQSDWQSLNVNLSWIDTYGNPVQVQAYPVAWSESQSFWAQVPADVDWGGIVISAEHPYHTYTFMAGDEYGVISFVDVGSELIDGMGVMLRAFEGDALADVFYIYVSTTAAFPQEPQQQPTEPPAPQQAKVEVVHRADDGTVLYQETVTVTQGYPQSFGVMDFGGDYMIDPSISYTVDVDEYGNPTMGQVEFVYQKHVVPDAIVRVRHITDDGSVLADTQESIAPGSAKTFEAIGAQGYTCADATPVTVQVDASGVPSRDYVEFYYVRDLRTADILVQHINTLNEVLIEDIVHVTENTPQTIMPLEFPGYAPQSAEGVTVSVDANGNASHGVVILTYLRVADVKVLHLNIENETLAEDAVHLIEGVAQSVSARAIEGFVPEAESLNLVLSQNGTVEPDPAVLYYHPIVTEAPTAEPTPEPTPEPTEAPTEVPTEAPTEVPTETPTEVPTEAPTAEPTEEPTSEPTAVPTEAPTPVPPTEAPTEAPTAEPTEEPTAEPTAVPTEEPTPVPPTEVPTDVPTAVPTEVPTEAPTAVPTAVPTEEPTVVPTAVPTDTPAPAPTEYVPAMLIVRYVDASTGADLAARDTKVLAEGGNLVMAEPDKLPDGWEIAGKDRETVYVENGHANMDEVIFTCVEKVVPTAIPTATPTAAPEWGTVLVHYRSASGRQLADDQTKTLAAGQSHEIGPDRSLITYDYDVDSVPAQTVVIGADGKAQPAEIVFTIPLKKIPVGEVIDRFGKTNASKVLVRSKPGGDSIVRIEKDNSYVWLVREVKDGKNESWYEVIYNNKEGYMKAQFVDLLSVQESDERQQALVALGATPVPFFAEPTAEPTVAPTEEPTAEPTVEPTAVPTAEPTEEPTVEPTAVPTEAPTTVSTDVPTEAPTQVPERYTGYALTKTSVPLRDGVSEGQSDTIMTMQQDTLVYVEAQLYTPQDENWSRVVTLDQVTGYVLDSNLRHIGENEAAYYIDLWQQQHPVATEQPTQNPVPETVEGWFYTVGDNVPYRNMASDRSVLLAILPRATAVYVKTQVFGTEDGWPWHLVQYGSQWGYIRSDMLRLMTEDELQAYLDSMATPAPTPEATPAPYDANSLSSYGYIYAASSGRVNLRQQPSTHSGVVKELRNYAFCLITGTEVVDNTVWYRVEFGNDRGYVRSDLLKQMTLSELEEFLNSSKYQEGIQNNTAPSATATTGAFISQEQQNANIWKDPNSGLNIAYATWVPMATPAPLPTEQPTAEAMETPEIIMTATPEPTQTPVPLATVEMIDSDGAQSGSSMVWIVLVVLLLLIGGGVYVVIMQRENKRKAAQRAAQRRAAQAAQQRAANGQQPRTGAYPQPTAAPAQPQHPATVSQRPASAPVQQTKPTQAAPLSQPVASTYQRPAAPAQPTASTQTPMEPKTPEQPAAPAQAVSEVPHRQRRVDRLQHQNESRQDTLDT